jgi:hypothetical protein
MTSPDDLREQIRHDTAALTELADQRDTLADLLQELRDKHKDILSRIRVVMVLRDQHITRARSLGCTTQQLADDTGLTAERVRQVAPARRTTMKTQPAPTVEPADITEAVQTAPATEQAPTRAPLPRRAAPAPRGTFSIPQRVNDALSEHQGDTDAAIAALIKTAIPDAMQLLDACRVGATYDYTAHPSIPDPLKRPGKKQPDQIWEARPRYTNPRIGHGVTVTILDTNAAYLAALRRVHLPIGKLVNTREIGEDPAVYNRKRSGIYLIEPSPWEYTELPNPLGDGREQDGPVWITDATLRLMLRASKLLNGYEVNAGYKPPRILESFTSGSTENLLAKFGDVLADARRTAIDHDDTVTLEYVKAMYSRFVSTCGDSGANHEIHRPDWTHIIRSQAFANLWYKAHKAWDYGLGVYRMSGTDELHLSGNVHRALTSDEPLFPWGRDLAQIKIKGTYVLGEDRDRA